MFCATKDSCSNLWFGNASGNLICYDWSSDSFHIYPLNYLGKKGKFLYSGLNELTPVIGFGYALLPDCTYLIGRQVILNYSHCVKSLKEDAEPWVTAICEDKQRNIWIGTAKGIVRLSQVNVRPLKMVHGYEEKENIGARVVSALLTGTDGTVYVGYKNGFGIIPVGEDRI